MINWFKKAYSEGRWGFWSIMFLFPVPLIFVFIDVFLLDLETEFNYGWFFAPFIFCGFMHQRDLGKKEKDREKKFEDFDRKRKKKENLS